VMLPQFAVPTWRSNSVTACIRYGARCTASSAEPVEEMRHNYGEILIRSPIHLLGQRVGARRPYVVVPEDKLRLSHYRVILNNLT